jgi:hypothetical protein
VYTVPTIQATFCWCVHGTNCVHINRTLPLQLVPCTHQQKVAFIVGAVYTSTESCLYSWYRVHINRKLPLQLVPCTHQQKVAFTVGAVYTSTESCLTTVQATFCWCVHGTNCKGNVLLMCTRYQLYRQLSLDVYTVPTIQATFCWCLHGTNCTGNFLLMCTRYQL